MNSQYNGQITKNKIKRKTMVQKRRILSYHFQLIYSTSHQTVFTYKVYRQTINVCNNYRGILHELHSVKEFICTTQRSFISYKTHRIHNHSLTTENGKSHMDIYILSVYIILYFSSWKYK